MSATVLVMEQDIRSERVTIRLTPKEFRDLYARAEASARSVSDFARILIVGKAKGAKR